MKFKIYIYSSLYILLLFSPILLPGKLLANQNSGSLSNDISVLYIFDEYSTIDWPLICHLGMEKTCQINLVSIRQGPEFHFKRRKSSNHDISSYQFFLPEKSKDNFQSILAALNDWRLPDLVIFSDSLYQSATVAFEDYLLNLHYNKKRVFNIQKILRYSRGEPNDLYINNEYYLLNYKDELRQLLTDLSIYENDIISKNLYSPYRLIENNLPDAARTTILSGINKNRLKMLVDSYVDVEMMRSVMKSFADNFLGKINLATESENVERINALVGALEALYEYKKNYYMCESSDSISTLGRYINHDIKILSSEIFESAGIDIKAQTRMHDTPQGSKLDLLVSIRNNGPIDIKTGEFMVKPDWSDRYIGLPIQQKEIKSLNSLEQEITLDIDAEQLKLCRPESMEVACSINYRNLAIECHDQVKIYSETPLNVALIPNFSIIKPLSNESIDKLVEPVYLKALITKPADLSVDARIEVVPPPGMMVGAYRRSIALASGTRSFDFSIPLVATRNMNSGKNPLIINLIEDKNILAADTAHVSIVDTKFDQKSKIALIAGENGLLEDILIATGANYRTISDRYLETRDIDQFDIIAMGTGCFNNIESPPAADSKLKRFMEFGGTLLIFGQTGDWPENMLPVSIAAAEQSVQSNRLSIIDKSFPLFQKSNGSKFLEAVNNQYKSYPAAVRPSKSIICLDNNFSLLSESKFEKGKLIYCGLPILEMFQNLDMAGITFFSSLIEYSAK